MPTPYRADLTLHAHTHTRLNIRFTMHHAVRAVAAVSPSIGLAFTLPPARRRHTLALAATGTPR